MDIMVPRVRWSAIVMMKWSVRKLMAPAQKNSYPLQTNLWVVYSAFHDSRIFFFIFSIHLFLKNLLHGKYYSAYFYFSPSFRCPWCWYYIIFSVVPKSCRHKLIYSGVAEYQKVSRSFSFPQTDVNTNKWLILPLLSVNPQSNTYTNVDLMIPRLPTPRSPVQVDEESHYAEIRAVSRKFIFFAFSDEKKLCNHAKKLIHFRWLWSLESRTSKNRTWPTIQPCTERW